MNQTEPTALMPQDRCYILRPLGEGGFGRTFLSLDELQPSQPKCVLKQFLPRTVGPTASSIATALFREEAQRLRELGAHPQIPALIDYFEQDDNQYIVQKFIVGADLEEELAIEGAFNESQIRQFLKDLLPVLQFVHDRQVIH